MTSLTLSTFATRIRTDAFKRAHPRTFAALSGAYRLVKGARYLRYLLLYNRYKAYTMLHRENFANNLALCDCFRHIPGAVVECGTWKGGMSAGMATSLGPDRHYYLYDSYEGLPPATAHDTDHYGQSGIEWQQRQLAKQGTAPDSNNRAAIEDARAAMKLSGAPHVTITKGWFADTLPTYTGGPIAILRCDGDWYESTRDTLVALYPHVVSGGVIILDDYHYWDGCAKAVHEFLLEHGGSVREFGGYAYIWKR